MYSDRVSGTWAPGSNTTFHPARTIRWRELTGLKHLADGAMCSCYTAHLAGHGTVVVKKPSRRSNETLEEIERELDIEKAYLASLHHPNIVRLIGSGRRGIKNNFQPFLVLEYLSGNTLANLISKRRRGEFEIPHFVLDGKKNYIPWAQAMGWAQDMASALHYMHHEASPGYMYICRDLKPDNIGFAADGTLKMFDMGLAKRVARKSGTNQRYTMTSRCGTLRYMPPEAFLGCSYNEKVDVYAWSHVVAEMLSLDVPYEHMGTHEFRVTVALGRRRPNVERRWPRSIQRLLRRCWDRDPAVRPSFGEILEAGVLEQAAGPRQSWFHHFSLRRPSSATATRDETTAVADADQNLTERASRGRVATIDLSGDPNHRSPAPQPEGASVAPLATVGDSEEEDATGVGTGLIPPPQGSSGSDRGHYPCAFFGGGARA